MGAHEGRHIGRIKDGNDIEKIRMPEISYDEAKTEEHVNTLGDIFDGVLSVEPGWTSMRS